MYPDLHRAFINTSPFNELNDSIHSEIIILFTFFTLCSDYLIQKFDSLENIFMSVMLENQFDITSFMNVIRSDNSSSFNDGFTQSKCIQLISDFLFEFIR